MLLVPVAVAQEAVQTEAIVAPSLLAPPPAPAWPDGADMDAGEAAVALLLSVDETGAIGEIRVESGATGFVEAAIAVARALSLAPATEAGIPIAVELPFTVHFVPPPVVLEGRVRISGGSTAPASGLPLRIDDQLVLTDGDGRFRIRGLTDGPHTLEGADPAGRVARRTFQVVPGQVVQMELWARPEGYDRGIVGIYRKERDEVRRRSLTAAEVRTTPGTLGDPLRAVSNLPGTVRSPLDTGWLLVRGGDPRDTGVYIDGVRVPLIYHLGGFTSVIHPGFVERVEFFPGGQPARYGRATAGAVDLVTRPRADRLELRAGMNLVFAGAFASVPWKQGGVTVAARRSYLDFVLANLVPGLDEEQASIAPKFSDWQARVDWDGASVMGFGYTDVVDLSDAEGQRVAIGLSTQRVHGRYALDVADKPFRLSPYAAWESRQVGIQGADVRDTRLAVGGGGRAEFLDDGTGRWGWSGGLDAEAFRYGLRTQGITREGTVVSPDPHFDVRVGGRTRAILGVRVDTVLVEDQQPRAGVSPRVGLHHTANEWVGLDADAGIYHQSPDPALLIGPPEGASLKLERSWGGGAGVSVHRGPWGIELNGWGRSIENLTSWEDDGSLGQGEGLAFGLETLLRGADGPLSGWVSYAWVRSLRREEAGLPWGPSSYDQPDTLNAVVALDLGRNWTLASRFRYGSGFPVPDDVEDPEAYDALTQSFYSLVGEEGRLEPFHALDVKISKVALYRRWRLEYYLDLQNVYNRRVPEPVITGLADVYESYSYGFGLPVLPIFGVEGIFGGER